MSAGVTPLPPDLLPVQRQATRAYRLARLLGIPLLRLLFRFRIRGREHIPAGNFVIIANHLNWLDSFAILMSFRAEPRVHFLGDPTVLAQRRVQWLVVRSVGGYVPVDRSHHADVRLFAQVNRCLALGGVVALYPEGNYGPGEGGPLLPFKSGFAHFAIDNRVPVIPVALTGTKDLWLRKPIEVVIGEPLPWEGHTVPSLVALAQERLTALLPRYHEPRGPKLVRRRLTHLF
jgi:1-acyl-sn-glycerol-3-phosphate acyltransferase